MMTNHKEFDKNKYIVGSIITYYLGNTKYIGHIDRVDDSSVHLDYMCFGETEHVEQNLTFGDLSFELSSQEDIDIFCIAVCKHLKKTATVIKLDNLKNNKNKKFLSEVENICQTYEIYGDLRKNILLQISNTLGIH